MRFIFNMALALSSPFVKGFQFCSSDDQWCVKVEQIDDGIYASYSDQGNWSASQEVYLFSIGGSLNSMTCSDNAKVCVGVGWQYFTRHDDETILLGIRTKDGVSWQGFDMYPPCYPMSPYIYQGADSVSCDQNGQNCYVQGSCIVDFDLNTGYTKWGNFNISIPDQMRSKVSHLSMFKIQANKTSHHLENHTDETKDQIAPSPSL